MPDRYTVLETKDEFVGILSTQLAAHGLSSEKSTGVAKHLEKFFRGSPPGHRVAAFSWIIRNEDLQLLANITPAAITTSTALADSGSLPATVAAIATSIASALTFGRRLLKHAIRLTSEEYEIALLLRSAENGLSSDEILEALQGEGSWSPSQVSEILTRLSEKRARNGELKNIVQQDSEGRWHAVDI